MVAFHTHLTVQPFVGNISITPPPFGICPHDGDYSAPHCGALVGDGAVEVENFSNDLPTTFETNLTGSGMRYIDRGAQIHNPVNGVGLYAYQRNQIFGLTGPPNWSSVHTSVNQESGSNYTQHGGIYPCMARDGSELYWIAFYRGTVNDTIFYNKYQPSTDTWTSHQVSPISDGALPGTFMFGYSTPVEWRGKLWFNTVGGWIIAVDPLINEVRGFQIPSTFIGTNDAQSRHFKLIVRKSRLFVVCNTDGGSNLGLRILEAAYGGFINHGLVGPHNAQAGGDLDFVLMPWTDGVFYPFWYANDGGGNAGWLCYKIAVQSSKIGETLLLTDRTSIVVPDGGPNSAASFDNFNINMQWPNANPTTVNIIRPYASIDSVAGGAGRNGLFGLMRLWKIAGTPYNAERQLGWNGENTMMRFGNCVSGDPIPIRMDSWSPTTSFRGGAEHLLNRGGWQLLSYTPYSDAIVNRGLLLTFYGRPGGGGFANAPMNLQVILNSNEERPDANQEATLSIGTGIIIGGGASLNTSLNRLENAPPDGTIMQIIWDWGADGYSEFDWTTMMFLGLNPTNTVSDNDAGFDGYYAGPTMQVQVQIDPSTDLNAHETAGPAQGVNALSDTSTALVTGPAQGVNALSDTNAALVAGPAQSIVPTTDLIPFLAKPVTSRPYEESGGTFGFQLDGVEQAERATININSNSLIGQSYEFNTRLPEGPSVTLRLDSIVELGRATFDAVNDALNSTQIVLDLAAAGIETAFVEHAVVVATNVSGVTAQPLISIGTNTSTFDDQLATTALNLESTNQSEELVTPSPSKIARAQNTDTIFVQLDGLATATTYTIEIIVYGRVT